MLLRDPSYSTFSSRLKAMSEIFGRWVGGHMTTDQAPYDPVFLAHAAYLDKLWDDWQRLSPEGILSFPASVRFAPMEPFSTSPDDVFGSEKQLCVRYVPLTEGATCRQLLNPGADMSSASLEYDVEGIDNEGYMEGFDSQGFDRNGLYVDSVNRDFFDESGYDRFGYDRYGYDKHGFTTFGYHRNGTYRNGINETLVESLFDTSGYNKYGYNKYGYDRQGYDVFGFDLDGRDRNGCVSHSRGPFYVLHKAALDDLLSSLTMEELLLVRQLCGDLGPGWPALPRGVSPSTVNPSHLWMPAINSQR